MHFRSGGIDPGRDGCRVPLPWAGTARPFGFSPAGAAVAVAPPAGALGRPDRRGQLADPGSMLHLYRDCAAIRRAEAGLGDGPMAWLPSGPGRARVRARRSASSA